MIDPSEYFRQAQHPSSFYPPGTAETNWQYKEPFIFQDRDLEESFLGEISVDDTYLHIAQNDGRAVFIPHKRGHGFVETFDYLPQSVTVGMYQTPNGRSKLAIQGLGEVDVTGLEGWFDWLDPVVNLGKKALEVAKKVIPFIPKPKAPQPPSYTPPSQQYIPPGQQYVPGQQYQVPSPYPLYSEPKKISPLLIAGIAGGVGLLGLMIFVATRR